MAEQTSTPGSTGDTSMNGSISTNRVAPASKDKSCPFCLQSFTSSSLGRHLDLYIKEKNPKPADGIHIVSEIMKLRGNITRRQPRSSISRTEESTPRGTPGIPELKSPRVDSELSQGCRDESLKRDDTALDSPAYSKRRHLMNNATWEATGVINNIPPAKNGDAGRSWGEEDRDNGRRTRSASRQVLAKVSFEQKQKTIEALDSARAAELALKEVLLSIRAALNRTEGLQIFDFDPLSLSFPALVLHCLPSPPTLQQSTPLPSPNSWNLTPPSESQHRALLAHFSAHFHNWRISHAIATTAPRDDLSYPPTAQSDKYPTLADDVGELAQRAEVEAAELEAKISAHIYTAYTHWTALPSAQRTELWILELARSVGRKSEQIQRLEREKELSQQESAHLRLQVDEFSRLQQPREFSSVPPAIIPYGRKELAFMGEMGLNLHSNGNFVGVNVGNREMQIAEVVERSIGRWKSVVRSTREGGRTLSAQRALSGSTVIEKAGEDGDGGGGSRSEDQDADMETEQIHEQQDKVEQTQETNQEPNEQDSSKSTSTSSSTSILTAPTVPPNPQSRPPPLPRTNTTTTLTSDDALGSDADADADMEEDDSYVGMTGLPTTAPLINASGEVVAAVNGGGMEGVENHKVVNGYVRIGA